MMGEPDSSRDSGSNGGKYRTFSSKRSKIDVIQRSPNHTRGRTPWATSSGVRVSMDCSNTGTLDSCHSLRPMKSGELALRAACTPAIACDAFHASANRLGATCKCNCIDVHAASGATSLNSAENDSRLLKSMCTSSPRDCTTMLDKARYRFSSVIHSGASKNSCVSVGNVPIDATRAPHFFAPARAAMSLASKPFSKFFNPAPATDNTGWLSSKLNEPISV